jgi:hypothetical protein
MLTDDERRELGAIYNSALFEVDFEDGTERFRVGPGRSGRPPFALVTAYNPGFERPSVAENEHANKALRALLAASNITSLPARGSSDPETHTEPSFALFNIAEAEALNIARRFRQAAVFAWDGHEGRIVWCD